MIRTVFVLGLALLAVPSGRAVAQQTADLSSEEEEARSLFEAARTAYAAGRYEAALERFREAYELSRRPALLFNMATAADRLRRDAEALDLYERFLEAEPDSPQRREVEARIGILRQATQAGEAGAEQATHLRTAQPDSGVTPDRVGDDGLVVEQWWFWALIGVLVAGGVTATLVATTTSGGIEAPIPGTDGVVVMALRFE